MAMPPMSPIRRGVAQLNYFDLLVEQVTPFFKENGIELDFSGYRELERIFGSLKMEDAESSWELARRANAWSEYFSDLKNLTKKYLADTEAEKLKIFAIASTTADVEKVANGNRLADKDENVVAIRRIRNGLEAFYEALEAKVEYLERMHYFCKSTCEWGAKASISKRNEQ